MIYQIYKEIKISFCAQNGKLMFKTKALSAKKDLRDIEEKSQSHPITNNIK